MYPTQVCELREHNLHVRILMFTVVYLILLSEQNKRAFSVRMFLPEFLNWELHGRPDVRELKIYTMQIRYLMQCALSTLAFISHSCIENLCDSPIYEKTEV